MKFYNRIFSTLLAVILMLGSVSFLTFDVGAAGTTAKDDDDIESVYIQTVYNTPEEKVFGTEENPSTMEMMLEHNGYQLYVDRVSGEIALVDNTTPDTATKKILFSNPYDIASSVGSASTKKNILSQLVVQFVDNGSTKYLYSFEEAAMRNQINVLNIKNGVRVEYTIGREESRKLVPRWISVTNFEKFIDEPLKAAVDAGEISSGYYQKFMSYYNIKALSQQGSKKARDELLKEFPICEKMDIYAINGDIVTQELNWCEIYIKAYCEDYTFEQMEADHEETGYVAPDEKYPVFKMALEYSIADDGSLSVRLPCNGLRYDMDAYALDYISILPYMGAGNSTNSGYNFYPDGAGALFDFEQLNTKGTTTVRGKVYGTDYAYHTITGSYQKAIRYPVYGTRATETLYTFTYSEPEYVENKDGELEKTGNMITDTLTVSNTVMSKEEIEKFVSDKNGVLLSKIEEESYTRGYVAVIEEGESLAELATYHAGGLSDYNTMMNYFNPKPKDSYDIADSISVTTSSSWTVVSERKYTGSIKLRYTMLTDENVAKAAKEEVPTYTSYDTTWLGMAEAYRDYLYQNGTLKKLENTEDDIPLYLEVFGAFETQQTILTFPVYVMTPLTTFENIYQMYESLSSKDVGNINFKMTGFANGGMFSTVPASLKWESAVGGKDGFEELVEKANKVNTETDNHLGLYPDFDFAYVQSNTLFDSTNLKKDAAKTIDNRYSSKREYSATLQTYISFYELAISPSRYSKFYNKLLKNYEQYGLNSMSVASLGSALNSDFDEDDPYNREDNKEFTVQAFQDLQAANYSLMTDSANAYTWGYVDHILNVDLDSSRYVKSSASVPFVGAVLHGYVQFAGTPLNEEGDTDYAILRAIENGAGLYFILSYQNTSELKESYTLSQYYSVRYDIWEEDVISYYTKLNSLLKDVQTKVIIDHKFLNEETERILDLDELQEHLAEQLKNAAEAEQKKQNDIETGKVVEAADAWRLAENASAEIQALIDEMARINEEEIKASFTQLNGQVTVLPNYVNLAITAIKENAENKQDRIDALTTWIDSVKMFAIDVLHGYENLEACYQEVNNIIAAVENAKSVIADSNTLTQEVRDTMLKEIDEVLLPAATALLVDAEAEFKRVETESQLTKDQALDLAVNSLTVVTSEDADVNAALQEACKDYFFDKDQIIKESQTTDEDSKSEDDDNKVAEEKEHVLNNNQVVLVTYGDRDSTTFEKTAYKSFILNYNNFAVRVTVGDDCYTIPAGGYVVIYHQ